LSFFYTGLLTVFVFSVLVLVDSGHAHK